MHPDWGRVYLYGFVVFGRNIDGGDLLRYDPHRIVYGCLMPYHFLRIAAMEFNFSKIKGLYKNLCFFCLSKDISFIVW